jgi:hypothetical protein
MLVMAPITMATTGTPRRTGGSAARLLHDVDDRVRSTIGMSRLPVDRPRSAISPVGVASNEGARLSKRCCLLDRQPAQSANELTAQARP